MQAPGPATLAATSVSASTVAKAYRINWDKYDLINEKGAFENKVLNGTKIKCSTNGSAAQAWNLRKKFIEHVVKAVIAHCPKDEPLALISLGSEHLLTEHIVAHELMANGFRQIQFLLVDPRYLYNTPLELGALKGIMTSFRERINKDYHDLFKEKFEEENLKFLSRAQNIQKYFKPNSNVVLIESLPPYAESFKDLQQKPVTKKSAEDLFMGSRILTQNNQANSIIMLPASFVSSVFPQGAQYALLPTGLMGLQGSTKHMYYVDAGCKISSDGTYRLSMTGLDEFFLDNGRPLPGMGAQLSEKIKTVLDHKIKEMKGDRLESNLNEKQIAELLEIVKTVTNATLPIFSFFYSVDYLTDRAEAMNYLSKNASHHYRENFLFTADPDNTSKITQEQIPAVSKADNPITKAPKTENPITK